MFGEFDEAAYLRANPDVRGLIERGHFRSGFEHWHAVGANEHALGDRLSGFYEHDLIYDEATYVRQNPDVADAVRTRAVRHGYQHWIRFGRQEFARGVRWGPFAAKSRFVRPFKLELGDGTILLVASVPGGVGQGPRAEVRTGNESPVTLEASAAAGTPPIVIADACGATTSLPFFVCRAPLGLVFRPLTRVTLSITTEDGRASSHVYGDAGVQAFYFATADGANEFLGAARRCSTSVTNIARDSLVRFTLDRLVGSPTAKGYEKPLRFRVERVLRVENDVRVSGWIALPANRLEGCRAWLPEIAAFFDVTEGWSRSARPDVSERFADELGSEPDDRHGFSAVLKLPVEARDARRAFFGCAEEGRAESWVDVDLEPARD